MTSWLLLLPISTFAVVASLVIKAGVDALEDKLPPTQKFVLMRKWRAWLRGLVENSKLHKFKVFFLVVIPAVLLFLSYPTVFNTPLSMELLHGGAIYLLLSFSFAAAGFIFGYGLVHISQPAKREDGMKVVRFE